MKFHCTRDTFAKSLVECVSRVSIFIFVVHNAFQCASQCTHTSNYDIFSSASHSPFPHSKRTCFRCTGFSFWNNKPTEPLDFSIDTWTTLFSSHSHLSLLCHFFQKFGCKLLLTLILLRARKGFAKLLLLSLNYYNIYNI